MKRLRIMACLLIVLSACSKEQLQEQSSARVPFLLNGKISNVSLTRADSSLTNATVGVYILQTDISPIGTLNASSYNNVLYNVDSKGVFTTDASVLLNNFDTYSTLGYAPYRTITDPKAVPFNHGEDVLYAPTVPVVITNSTASATLTFEHKMSRIIFKIVSGANQPDISRAALSVSGFYASCTIDLNSGILTPVMGTGVTITAADQMNYIVPGALKLDITVAIDGQKYTAKTDYAADPSKDCSYTLTVNSGNLGLDCQIVEWNPVNAGEIHDLK